MPASTPWTQGEDMLLLSRWHAGKPLKDIAALHGRSEPGVVARLAKLKRCTAQEIRAVAAQRVGAARRGARHGPMRRARS